MKRKILKELADENKIKKILNLLVTDEIERVVSMFVIFDNRSSKIEFKVIINGCLKKIECFSDVIEVG